MGERGRVGRLCAAVALQLGSMWATGVFWYFRTSDPAADALPIAGLLVMCAALLGLALFSAGSTTLGRHIRTCNTVAVVVAPCCALVVLAGGGFAHNEPVGLALACLCCIASWACNAFSLLSCAASLTSLRLPARVAVVTCAAVCAVAPRSLARMAVAAGQGVLLFVGAMAMCALACLLARKESCELLERLSQADEAPADVQLTQPATFLPFNHRLYLLLGVFGFSAGMSFYFGIDADYANASALSIAPLALVALVGFKVRKRVNLDALHIASFVIAAGAFLSIGFVWNESIIVSGALFGAAEACFYVLMFTLLAAIAQRNAQNAAVVFGWGLGLFVLGWGVCGAAFNCLAHIFIYQVPFLVFPLAWAFIAFNAWFLYGFSLDEAVAGIEEAREVVVPAPRRGLWVGDLGHDAGGGDSGGEGSAGADERRCDPPSLEAQVARIAGQAGLTEREREIFELLARGRNARYLQEQFDISRNTAKTHIAHVYTKLGVHSQQELIDLLEPGASPSKG